MVYFLTQAGDQRWVRTAGSALRLLHSLYGPFSKVYGIGRCSKVQYDEREKNDPLWCVLALPKIMFVLLFFETCMMRDWTAINSLRLSVLYQMAYESWREQVEEGEQTARQAEIGKVFLIDRGKKPRVFQWTVTCWAGLSFLSNVAIFFADVDFVTPLCSQVVYEGLVDDIFRIKCGGYQSNLWEVNCVRFNREMATSLSLHLLLVSKRHSSHSLHVLTSRTDTAELLCCISALWDQL